MFAVYALLIAIAAAASGTVSAGQRIAPRGGRQAELFSALNSGEAPRAAALEPLDDTTRREFLRRVAVRARYVPTVPRRPGRGEFAAIDDKKASVEGYLVACAGRREVSPTAALYSSTAVLAYEWEGYSEGPLAEAEHAEAYLRRYPRSVLRGGLELFLLSRYRAAFEAAGFSGQDEARQRAAEGYRAVWARVQAMPDPVIRAVARDIDEAQQVYIRTEGHPRTFGR